MTSSSSLGSRVSDLLPGRNSYLYWGTISAIIAADIATRISGTSSGGIDSGTIETQLGPWLSKWQKWTQFGRQALPSGSVISSRLGDGFCGVNAVHISRLPHGDTGTSSWSILLSIVRPSSSAESGLLNSKDSWPGVELQPLTLHGSKLCVKISRATLMTLFAMTNARPIYSYSSASGYRSSYPSYAGQWSISWPNGQPCILSLAPHDSHSAATDVYPPDFPVRVDKCMEMLAGIISYGEGRKIAFPGRAKSAGPWLLQERKKGFPGAHGSRHLYNMMGGKVFEVDFLVLVKHDKSAAEGMLRLEVPCLDPEDGSAVIFVPEHEQKLLALALDFLPWSSLSWSMHRGMRDILLAYGKETMDQNRAEFAQFMKYGMQEPVVEILVQQGWNEDFVRTSMADMIETSIMAGGGNSGDLVRVVVAFVEAVEGDGTCTVFNKDKTDFWGRTSRADAVTKGRPWKPDNNMVLALTKFFVLEWSQELDYQLYHQLPTAVFMA